MTEEKFRKVYAKYYRLVMRVAFDVLKDFNHSEDICQEVFIQLLEKSDFLNDSHYREWLAVYARRKAIDFCRKSYQTHEVVTARGDREGRGKDVHRGRLPRKGHGKYYDDEMIQNLLTREFASRVLEELSKYNRDWYEIIVRSQIEGQSDEEIAEALGITIGNLRIKRHRMRDWLKENYGDEYKSLL